MTMELQTVDPALPAPAATTAVSPWLRVRTVGKQVGDAVFGTHADDDATSGIDTFEREVQVVMSRRETRRAQRIVRVFGVVLLVLLVWSAFAHVEEVTRGEGRVVPSRQLQVVQSLDGGVVAEILVREGQQVEAGQLLLRIDETRATSGVRETAAEGFALQARVARLRALAEAACSCRPSRPARKSSASSTTNAACTKPR